MYYGRRLPKPGSRNHRRFLGPGTLPDFPSDAMRPSDARRPLTETEKGAETGMGYRSSAFSNSYYVVRNAPARREVKDLFSNGLRSPQSRHGNRLWLRGYVDHLQNGLRSPYQTTPPGARRSRGGRASGASVARRVPGIWQSPRDRVGPAQFEFPFRKCPVTRRVEGRHELFGDRGS